MMVPLKTCGFMRYTCTPNIKCLSPLDQKLWPKLYIWPLTLKNDLDLMMLPLKMCSLMIVTCSPNIKCLSLLDQILWPMWPIYLTFDLEGWPWPWQITPQNKQLHKIHIVTKYQVSICIGSKVMANVKVVWPNLYIWPLPLKNDLDLKLLPLKMCSLVRCTCTPNIKCLSQLDQMLWPKWKWTFLPIYLTFDLEEWPWP